MKYVEVQLAGGLGNQLFQYATARAIAARYAADVRVDLSLYVSDPLRSYELEAYGLGLAVAEPRQSPQLPEFPGAGRLSSTLRFLLRRYDQVAEYREQHFHYDPMVAELKPPVRLFGYWQSQRYFLDCADILRRELVPAAPIDQLNAALLAQIQEPHSVSLHVRRGDYVSNATTNLYHGVCGLDYYANAVAFVTERVPSAHLFVFSDDADWTKHNLILPVSTTFVSINPPDKGYWDLYLMSRCKHHIIANSSFSWWGAWLNPNVDKIVVAPRRWFGTVANDTRDLLPETWVRI